MVGVSEARTNAYINSSNASTVNLSQKLYQGVKSGDLSVDQYLKGNEALANLYSTIDKATGDGKVTEQENKAIKAAEDKVRSFLRENTNDGVTFKTGGQDYDLACKEAKQNLNTQWKIRSSWTNGDISATRLGDMQGKEAQDIHAFQSLMFSLDLTDNTDSASSDSEITEPEKEQIALALQALGGKR
jgi:hypothetical protein